MRERVVVTGLGVVSPFNPDGDRERFWASLCAGETAVGAVRSFDASAYACRVAAEVDRRLLHDGAADPTSSGRWLRCVGVRSNSSRWSRPAGGCPRPSW